MAANYVDGDDDFWEAAKNIRDYQNIFASGKNVSEMLTAHEDMRQRQRQQEMAALLREQNRLERKRNKRLKQQANAKQAEQKRLAGLPDCPMCHAKISGNRPEKCAHCASSLFWLGGRPLRERDAVAYLANPASCPEVASLSAEVEASLRALRTAAEAFGKVSPLVNPALELLARYCAESAANWEASRRAKLAAIEEEVSGLEETKETASDKAAARRWSWFWLELLLLGGVGCVVYFGGFGAKLWILTVVSATFLVVRALIRAVANQQAAQIAGESEFEKLIEGATARKRAFFREPVPESVQAAKALTHAIADLQGHLKRVASLSGDWSFLAGGLQATEGSRPEALTKYAVAAERFLTEELPAVCSRQDERPEAELLQMDGCVNETAEKLLQALCVVAGADGRLHEEELSVITSAVRDAGCPIEDGAMRATAMRACEEIYKVGWLEFTRRLCREWRSFRGTAFASLVLRLQREVATADGRLGKREAKLLQLFKESLGEPNGIGIDLD